MTKAFINSSIACPCGRGATLEVVSVYGQHDALLCRFCRCVYWRPEVELQEIGDALDITESENDVARVNVRPQSIGFYH